MESQSYTIHLSADQEGLRQLYDFVSDASLFFDLDDKTHFEIELAMEEAITNIIDHAYHGQGGEIVVTMSYYNDEIRIIIQDWGNPIQDDTLPHYDQNLPVEERINGGMGLHFMRTLMDSVKFDSSITHGTILTMTKHYKTVQPPTGVRDELSMLETISLSLSRVHDVQHLMILIVNRLTQAVSADRGTLYLVDKENHQLYSKILQADATEIQEIRLNIGEGIAGYVAQTGETVNIRSVKEDPHFAAQFDEKSGYETRNMICTPMRNAENDIIGVLQLINKKRGHFTTRDETLLHVLASQAAIAYENARLIESEKSKRQLADTLREVAAMINSSLDLESVLDSILEQLERVIPYQNASILLMDGDYFIVSASRGVNADAVLKVPIFRIDESAIFTDMVNTGSLIIPNIKVDDRWVHLESTSEMRGFLGSVLKYGDQVIGELTVIHKEEDYYTIEHADILTTFANQASAAIERARLHEESIQQARLRQEVETAIHIQKSLLPEVVPQIQGWEIAAHWHPAREVGGDFYDFIELADGRLGFVIADVSGKGVPAALFMALARTIFRTLATANLPVDVLMTKVNDTIKEDNRARLFVTLFYGVLNLETGHFDCVSAGHNPPMLVKSKKQEALELTTDGPALGVFPDLTYTHQEIHIEPDDVFVMYTDGITESINAEEEEFAEERLQATITDHALDDATTILASINQRVERFAGNLPPHDDATIIVIKRLTNKNPSL